MFGFSFVHSWEWFYWCLVYVVLMVNKLVIWQDISFDCLMTSFVENHEYQLAENRFDPPSPNFLFRGDSLSLTCRFMIFLLKNLLTLKNSRFCSAHGSHGISPRPRMSFWYHLFVTGFGNGFHECPSGFSRAVWISRAVVWLVTLWRRIEWQDIPWKPIVHLRPDEEQMVREWPSQPWVCIPSNTSSTKSRDPLAIITNLVIKPWGEESDNVFP